MWPRTKGATEKNILTALLLAEPRGFSHLDLFMSSISAAAWGRICKCSRELEALELVLQEDDAFNNSCLGSLACAHLRRLKLFGNMTEQLTDAGLHGLAMPVLDTLKIQEVSFSCTALSAFVATARLKTLSVNSCPAIRGDFPGMARLVASAGQSLTSLTLYSCRVNDTVMEQIASSCPSLEELDITWHNVGDNALASLGGSCTRLCRLILGQSYDPQIQGDSDVDSDDDRPRGCYYTDDGICQLVEARGGFVELDLSGSLISDVALCAIAAHCPALKTLILRLCDGDEEEALFITLRGLQDVLTSCSLLQRLLVGGRAWHQSPPHRRFYNLAEAVNREVLSNQSWDDQAQLCDLLPGLSIDHEWHQSWSWSSHHRLPLLPCAEASSEESEDGEEFGDEDEGSDE